MSSCFLECNRSVMKIRKMDSEMSQMSALDFSERKLKNKK